MRSTIQKTTLAAALALSAGMALAQVRQVQLGNPLDANPGINTGGTNNPIPGFVPINGNDVVTGNVSGLAYFHGNDPLSSTYTFRGNLPSATLNGFARQSAPLQANGQAAPYYLPSATVSTGQGSLYSAPGNSGFDSRMVPIGAYRPTVTSQQLSALQGAVSGASIRLGPSAAPPLPQAGTEGSILNSPLFVLRTTEALAREEEMQKRAATQPSMTGAPATQPAPPTTNPDEVDPAIGGQVKGPIVGQSPEILGARANSMPTDARVGSVYAGLSTELNKVEGAGTETQPTRVQLVKSNDIDPLTGRPRLTTASATRPATATQPADYMGTAGVVSSKPLEDATNSQLTAGAKVKPLNMAAAPTPGLVPSAFDVLMARAEQMMHDGKFIDAQLAYQTALGTKPDDPLALVGLGHAELAAGAYASAANDLKFAFTRKPELVGVRYKPESFIPDSRQKFLLDDLQKQAKAQESADMASFLYCYLCYQTGRTADMQAELKQWSARPNHDGWAAVLQRAWESTPASK